MANEGDHMDIIATQNNNTRWSYDVFLCFRGEDTRYTFTGNLYNALCDKKIKTFMDHDGLKSGDHISTILKALEESRIAIVIFSKDFTSSAYCLNEVVKIIECQKTHSQHVLPIFYGVDPSYIVCNCDTNKSSYQKLAEVQQQKFQDRPEKKQEWMSALSSVALATDSYKEWQLQTRNKYKYEYERIEEIVGWVTKTLPICDVFISFWGRDSRYSFVDFLHDALEEERFKIHMRDERSEDSDRIASSSVEKIEKSWLSIIVLSENYAYSSLCLEELVTILKRMGDKKQLVWPIFYKVEASDIRHQENSFGNAMVEHEKRFDSNSTKVQEWKAALAEVANLKGSHLKTGYEYETIEKVVKVAINALLYLPNGSSSFS